MNLTNEQIDKLIELRGGCLCHVSPPCSACTELPTDAELLAIGAYCELPQMLQSQAS
ncbi:MAG: hypothetical protein ACYC4K_06190 [Thiobacillus sp.]